MKYTKKFLLIFIITLMPFLSFASAPEPTTSEYLKSVGGGFLVNKNFLDFEYALHLEIVKPLPEKAKLIAQFENPDNPQKPLESNVFLGNEKTIIVVSSPVKHLKIRNYFTEVKIYSDDTLSNLISTHKQELNSNFDYNNIRDLVASKAAFPELSFQFDFDNRHWKKVSEKRNELEFIREYVLNEEEIDNWSELITIMIVLKDINAEAVIDHVNNDIGKSSVDYKSKIIKHNSNDMALIWSHKGSGEWPPQREVKRVVKARDGLYTISYSVRENNYNPETYKFWEDTILSADLL